MFGIYPVIATIVAMISANENVRYIDWIAKSTEVEMKYVQNLVASNFITYSAWLR